MSDGVNGSVPIIGAGVLDENLVNQVELNWPTMIQRLGALNVWLMSLPLREMVEVNKRMQTRGALTLSQEEYAAGMHALRTDGKILEVALSWQRILMSAANS